MNEFIAPEINHYDINFTSYCWKSPSNIALIKYWGKFENQIPSNPSISFTLKNSFTKTKIKFSKSDKPSNLVRFEIFFEGVKNSKFRLKLENYFSNILEYCSYLKYYELNIETENSFPHSSGIASSASGLSAISLCIMSLEKDLTNNSNKEYFYKKASFLSRIGSGSACRSVYGGVNIWGGHKDFNNSSNFYSTEIKYDISDVFKDYKDSILIIDENQKSVSSTKGHALMNNHPYSEKRFKSANENISKLKVILKSGNLTDFCELVENEALTLHALMMTSSPSHILTKPNTLQVITMVREFRIKQNIPVCFTLDAGANIHLLYPKLFSEKISDFINNDLMVFCENKTYIDDCIGEGPVQI